MGSTFPKYNIQGHNWPEGVPFPPVDLAVTAKIRGKGKHVAKPNPSKGKAKAQEIAKAKEKLKMKDEDDSDEDYDVCAWDEEYEGNCEEEESDDDKGKEHPRSVGNLPLTDLHFLGHALCDEHYPLHFVIYDEGGPDGWSTTFYITVICDC